MNDESFSGVKFILLAIFNCWFFVDQAYFILIDFFLFHFKYLIDKELKSLRKMELNSIAGLGKRLWIFWIPENEGIYIRKFSGPRHFFLVYNFVFLEFSNVFSTMVLGRKNPLDANSELEMTRKNWCQEIFFLER